MYRFVDIFMLLLGTASKSSTESISQSECEKSSCNLLSIILSSFVPCLATLVIHISIIIMIIVVVRARKNKKRGKLLLFLTNNFILILLGVLSMKTTE